MFMWMLHGNINKIMKHQNVYVNVTWRDNGIKMFLWMLHGNLEEIMGYRNVYVNVTW